MRTKQTKAPSAKREKGLCSSWSNPSQRLRPQDWDHVDQDYQPCGTSRLPKGYQLFRLPQPFSPTRANRFYWRIPFPAPCAPEGLPITLPYPMDQRTGTWHRLDLSQSPSPCTTIAAQRWLSQTPLRISLSSSSWWSTLSFDMAKLLLFSRQSVSCSWCLTLCDPVDYSPSGSSVHGILQARIPEYVALLFSRGYSWPRSWTWVSCISGRFFTIWATRDAQRRGRQTFSGKSQLVNIFAFADHKVSIATT